MSNDDNRTRDGPELIQEKVDGSGWGQICTGEEEKVLVVFILLKLTLLSYSPVNTEEHEQHGKNR